MFADVLQHRSNIQEQIRSDRLYFGNFTRAVALVHTTIQVYRSAI